MKNSKTRNITGAAMTAALYVLLTLLSQVFGLASGSIQVRLSESLTIMPVFFPEAVVGLPLGCLLANIITGCTLPDIVFGTLATLIGAYGTYILRKKVIFGLIPPILSNTIIVPLVLAYSYNIHPIWFSVITVGAGEIISCGILGYITYRIINKNRSILKS